VLVCTVTLLELERDADGVRGMKRILVLTPSADAFLRGELALVHDVAWYSRTDKDGTVLSLSLGSLYRSL